MTRLMRSRRNSSLAASARRVGLLLAVERVRSHLRRRQRLDDTRLIEGTTAAFVGAVFRAQGEAMAGEFRRHRDLIDWSSRARATAAVDGLWARAAAETAAAFERGMRAALQGAMVIGARRTASAMGLSESVGLAVPPPTRAQVRHVFDWTRQRDIADLRGTPFSLDNPRAVSWLERHAAELVARVDDQTRDILRGIVSRGVEGGLSSERIGQDIIDRFPDMAEGRPQEHIDSRADGIAVTEMAYGYEAGQRAVGQELADAGLTVVKAWLTVGDDAVDDICTENEDEGEVAFEDQFGSGDTEPPAHPYCRCTTEYRVLTSDELPGDATAP